ncbi:hypothetical protein [Reyranella sp.]|uniref:hypothetical protein n=1 Tax=Reyranella sp. TaxID=1929291 RepID=UPI003BAC5B6B
MNATDNKPRSAVRPYRRPMLTWIDFLVIAAIILTAAAIVSSTVGRARAAESVSTRAAITYDPPTYSTEVGQISDDPGLIKAKIRLAVGAPWS